MIDWTAVVAIVTALVLLYKAVTMTPIDAASQEASTVAKFEEAAGRAVERSLKYEDRIEELEASYIELKKDMDEKLSEVTKKLEVVQAWAERLCSQIYELGGTPVPCDEPIKKETKRRNYV